MWTPAHPWLAPPSAALRYRVMSRAFAAAAAVHLTLPDARGFGLAANAALAASVVLLALWGSLAGWALAIVGLALPLALDGDQLTQSVFLLGFAVAAVGCFVGAGAGRAERMDRGLAAAVRVLTVGTYALAAFHKLNRDFFDAAVSCATGGAAILADNWGIDALGARELGSAWPWLFIAAELSVVALLVVRPAAATMLAMVMHIPLTIVFAPAFAFVMIAGWTAFFTDADLRHLWTTARRRWRWIVVLGSALGLASFALYARRHWVVYPVWQLKEVLLWVGLVWAAAAWMDRSPRVLRWWGAFREGAGARRRLVIMLGALFACNGLLPYTGLSFHHSGAMLSNLRIDDGCWNSALVPETVRVIDPYVRLDDVTVAGDVRGADALAADLETRLWNRRSLQRYRDDFCRRGAAPVAARVRWAGRDQRVADLCASLPFDPEPLPGVARYQHALRRECPQACIH